jgi:hypothetical protein
MQSTTLEQLDWLHDSVVHNVVYDASGDSGRLVKLAIRCHAQSGYAPWEGKDLVLAAIDVAVSKHTVWGWVTAPETIDAIRPGVSAAVRDSTLEARRMGARLPNLEFTISFHSGSLLEVICRELQVEVSP